MSLEKIITSENNPCINPWELAVTAKIGFLINTHTQNSLEFLFLDKFSFILFIRKSIIFSLFLCHINGYQHKFSQVVKHREFLLSNNNSQQFKSGSHTFTSQKRSNA